MGLLAPWFLAGLVAVGLPVYLHLLRRKQSRQLAFSSLMLFERRLDSSVKRRYLHYRPLLLLRLLLLLLLALAFANPYFRSSSPVLTGSQKLVVLAVDESFSMRHSNRFERARDEALRVAQSLSGADRAQVIGIGAQSRLVTNATRDKAEVLAALRGLRVGDSRGSWPELARAVRGIAQQSQVPVEVHLFSDMQQSALSSSFADVALPPRTTLVPHAVGGADRNWFVEAVAAPKALYTARKVRVQATIAGSNTEAATRTVSLQLNGKTLESKSVAVPAGGRATVEFLSLEAPYGLNRGEVRIDGADALTADDRFAFAVERGDPRKALFVYESRQPRALLYYRAGLESAGESAFQVEPLTTDRVGSPALDKYAYVVLSDVASLPTAFERSLTRYVQGGGSVLVSVGALGAARGRVPVLDASISGSRYSTRTGEQFQTVAWTATEHPALRGTERWQGVKFFQTAAVQAEGMRVLAKLSDGTPLLLERRLGEGRVLVLASSLDNVANDFPLHPAWVPFTEQTAWYLTGLADRQPNVTVDTQVDLRASRDQGSSIEVLDPDGKRALSLAESTRAQSYALGREGYYEIRRSNGRNELVAAHADRRESNLTPLPAETVALWRNTGQPVAATAGATTEQPEERTNPLWWYVLLALAAVAVAESVMASRFLVVGREAR